MALRLGQYARVLLYHSSHHRPRPLGSLQRRFADGVGKCLLYSTRDVGRLVPPRPPPLHRTGDDRAARVSPHAGGNRRRLQGPARNQFLERRCLAAPCARALPHWLPAAVGSKGFLGHEGRDEHRRHHALHRTRTPKTGRRWQRLRPPHPHALLRPARGRHSRCNHRLHRRAYLSVPSPRAHAQGAPPPARRRLLARPSAARCRRLPRRAPRRLLLHHPLPRRRARRTGRCLRTILRRAARVVFPLSLPAAEIFSRRHRNLGRDRHPCAAHGRAHRHALRRQMETRPPLQPRFPLGHARRRRSPDLPRPHRRRRQPRVYSCRPLRRARRRARDRARPIARRHPHRRRRHPPAQRRTHAGPQALRQKLRELSPLRRPRRTRQPAQGQDLRFRPEGFCEPRMDRRPARSGPRRQPALFRWL